MLVNIYDNYRNSSENYRGDYQRKVSYKLRMDAKEQMLKNIAKMRELAGVKSDYALALKAGLNKSTLNKLNSNLSLPSGRTLNRLAKAVGYVTYDEFLRNEGAGTEYKTIEVPIMATAPGGAWSETIDQAEETIHYTPMSPGDFRGVRIKGRSMNRIVEDGSIAIVDISQRDPDKLVNQPVIVECGGEITAKVYRRNPERFEPHSDDPGFAPIFPNGECRIIGRIVSSQRHMPKFIK